MKKLLLMTGLILGISLNLLLKSYHNSQEYMSGEGYTPIDLQLGLGIKSDSPAAIQNLMKAILSGNFKDMQEIIINKKPDLNKKANIISIDCRKHCEHLGVGAGGCRLDCSTKSQRDISMLQFALESGNFEIIKYLITQGAKVTEEGLGVLVIATQNGDLDLVKDMLNKKVEINSIYSDGKTALMKAIEANKPDIATYLISQKADVNLADKDGKTPLMKAIAAKNVEMVRYLINNRADLNAKDKSGKSVLQLANDAGNRDIVRLVIGLDK